MRILLVEDEIKMGQSIKEMLEQERYTVDLALDGEDGLEQALVEEYDVIILDLGLPRMDGMEICRRLREEELQVPILMLTARDTTKDKIAGLDVGADDYLVKPFSIEELLARIRALMRRRGVKPQTILAVDSLRLDPKKKIITRGNEEVHLSAREYALLEYLMRNPNQVLSKQTLLEHVWGSEVDAFSNVIDVYIGYLRNKIDKQFPEEKPLLQTIKGMGYRLGRA